MSSLKYSLILFFISSFCATSHAQTSADTVKAVKLGDSAEGRMRAADFHAAINLYTLQLRTGIKMATIWYNRANAESFLDDFDNAAHDYDTALKLDSNIAMAYMNQAFMYMKMYKVKEAFIDYDKGLKQKMDSPTHANMYISRGNAYMALNKFTDAEPDFSKAVKYNPNSFQAWLQLGAVRRKLKKYKEALQDLDIGYKLDNENSDLLLLRGIVKYESGAYKASIPDFNASLKLRKSNETWYYRGQARLKLKQDSLAREDFNIILSTDKNNIGALNGRGEANFKMKHPKLAIKDYSRIIELRPEGGEGYANRAYVYTQIGEKQKACADWHKASELGITAAKEAIKKLCGK